MSFFGISFNTTAFHVIIALPKRFIYEFIDLCVQSLYSLLCGCSSCLPSVYSNKNRMVTNESKNSIDKWQNQFILHRIVYLAINIYVVGFWFLWPSSFTNDLLCAVQCNFQFGFNFTKTGKSS